MRRSPVAVLTAPLDEQVVRDLIIRQDHLLLAQDAELRNWAVALVPSFEDGYELAVGGGELEGVADERPSCSCQLLVVWERERARRLPGGPGGSFAPFMRFLPLRALKAKKATAPTSVTSVT